MIGWDGAGLEFDEFVLGDAAGAEDGDLGQGAADHGDFVAAVQTRAGLAVFEYLVRQFGLVLDGAEAVLEEEVGDAREETDRLDAVCLLLLQ